MNVTVIVTCIACPSLRQIAPGEIPADEVPMCPTCFLPMVPVKASAEQPS